MEKASELTKIKGIGPGRIKHFARLGLFSLHDLASFLPRSYLDYSKPVKIASAEDGEPAAIEVRFIGPVKTFRAKSGLTITTVSIGDETGNITASWFNQPYIARSIPKETGGYALGTVDKRTGARLLRASFSNELSGIIPVYPLTSGLTQSIMRSAVRGALEICLNEVEETLPDEIRKEYGLIPLKTAMQTVHFPKNTEELAAARRRLAFEDAAVLTIVLEKLRRDRKGQKGIEFNTAGILDEFLELLPFEPTAAQYSVMNEIALDMASDQPMSRLIQGDVGSGKTALALYAMFIAAKNGAQSVLMAPTEILAEQHFALLKRFFGERAAILKGHMSAPVKREVMKGIADGSIIAVTGTHALIEGKVEFKRLGLVITDEQHRFGVRQRAEIGKKAESPDTIIMSATPIPRTLSLILYGDLDVSLVKGMPPGRKPVITRLVPPKKRIAMYRYIEEQIKKERTQAYVVCPMIEENEDLERVRSAEAVYAELKENLSVRVALVHGKLKPAEKDAVMDAFRNGETDLLVSTTVIEVGVDVPNACAIVIESAERFGLAQLHQLRGRVGRGSAQSYCIFINTSEREEAKNRLEIMNHSNDGFKIAEEDLKQRGPGDLFGIRQSGEMAFHVADIYQDAALIKEASAYCDRLLMEDPDLAFEENAALREWLSTNPFDFTVL